MLKVLAPKQSETDSRFGRAVKAPCMYPPRPGGSGHWLHCETRVRKNILYHQGFCVDEGHLWSRLRFIVNTNVTYCQPQNVVPFLCKTRMAHKQTVLWPLLISVPASVVQTPRVFSVTSRRPISRVHFFECGSVRCMLIATIHASHGTEVHYSPLTKNASIYFWHHLSLCMNNTQNKNKLGKFGKKSVCECCTNYIFSWVFLVRVANLQASFITLFWSSWVFCGRRTTLNQGERTSAFSHVPPFSRRTKECPIFGGTWKKYHTSL